MWQSLHNYVGGTSASCPVAAGFFSNVNAARLAAGKGSLGWVTPALYAYALLFVNDVTSGNNAQCSGAVGFYATTGWDPVTGDTGEGRTDSPTLSLTHSLTRSLAHSLTHSLAHLLTHSLTRSLTHSHTHSLTDSLTDSLIDLHTHSLIDFHAFVIICPSC